MKIRFKKKKCFTICISHFHIFGFLSELIGINVCWTAEVEKKQQLLTL